MHHSAYTPPTGAGLPPSLQQQQRKPQPPPSQPPPDPFILKVLRLPCPSFRLTPSLDWRCDTFEPPSPSPSPTSPPSLPTPLPPSIAIPSTMGAVYSGETFRAAISISSALDHALTSLTIRLELQSGARRWPLIDTADPSLTPAPTHLPPPSCPPSPPMATPPSSSPTHSLTPASTAWWPPSTTPGGSGG